MSVKGSNPTSLLTYMSDDIVVDCNDCGADVDIEIGPKGVISGGHFATVLTAEGRFVEDDADLVDEYIDPEKLPDEHSAIVYTLCDDCCDQC